MKRAFVRLSALASFLACGSLAAACIHPPADWKGSLSQTGQTAMIFWKDGVEDLVIKPTYQSKSAAPPAELAWVVPLPNEPKSYGTVDVAAFQDLFEAWEKARPKLRAKGARSANAPRAQGIKLLPKAVVGDYTIQPIEARGKESGPALNAWLEGNGFSTVPLENMAYYLEREWVWLCVKAKTKAAKGDLRPLRITFETPRIVYPLKFSTHQGTFAVTLWVITEQPLADGWGDAASVYGFSGPQLSFPLPKSVAEAAAGTKLSGEGSVTKLQHPQLKGEGIARWKRDFQLEPAK